MADIRLAKPAAGATQSVPCEPEARFVFDFPTTDATLARDGDNLNIRFEDGSNLQLEGFYQQYNEENLPSFNIDGTEVAAADFFAAMNEPDLMPAAGPGTGTVANGARFHEWGDSALTGGIQHLDGLDWGFSRSFEWDDIPNAVGRNGDDWGWQGASGVVTDGNVPGGNVPSNEVPNVDVPVPNEPGPGDEGEHFIAATGATIVVDEGALGGGTGLHTAHGAAGRGAFVADVHGERGGSIELSAGGQVLVLELPRNGATSVSVPGEAPQFHVNGVDVAILGATSDGNGKWTVNYTYELTESVNHDQAAGQDQVKFDASGIAIKVTDVTGDVATSKLTVEVHDDAPVAADDSATVHRNDEEGGTTAPITGDVLANDAFGADGKHAESHVALVSSATGKYGELTLKADGSYSYQLNDTNEAVKGLTKDTSLEDTFTYKITDADGDVSEATLTITIKGGHPVTITPEDPEPDNDDNDVDANGGVLTVHDSGLAGGSEEGVAAVTTKGQFTVDAPDGLATITVKDAAGNELTVVNGDTFIPRTIETPEGTLTFTGFENNVLTYEFTLERAGAHPEDNQLSHVFEVTVTDTDGDTASSHIIVNIEDDAPEAADDANTVSEGNDYRATGNVLTGYRDDDAENRNGKDAFGADGKAESGSIEWGGLAEDSAYTLVDEGAAKAVMLGDQKVGTFELRDNGDYTFILEKSYTKGEGVELKDIKLEYAIKDADGDTSKATLTIEVKPATPDITPNTPTSEDGTIEAGSGRIIVDESALASGSQKETTHGTKGSGSVSIDLHGEDGSIDFGGLKFEVEKGQPVNPANEATIKVNGVVLSNVQLEQDGAKWKITYDYELKDAVTHDGPSKSETYAADAKTATIDIKVTDATGDTKEGALTV